MLCLKKRVRSRHVIRVVASPISGFRHFCQIEGNASFRGAARRVVASGKSSADFLQIR